jgi:hypothetical protein
MRMAARRAEAGPAASTFALVDLEPADKVAVVTGASKGIGLAIVHERVALLASPRNGDVTGANRVIDGGLIKTT